MNFLNEYIERVLSVVNKKHLEKFQNMKMLSVLDILAAKLQPALAIAKKVDNNANKLHHTRFKKTPYKKIKPEVEGACKEK